jgi:hypothetical protein
MEEAPMTAANTSDEPGVAEIELVRSTAGQAGSDAMPRAIERDMQRLAPEPGFAAASVHLPPTMRDRRVHPLSDEAYQRAYERRTTRRVLGAAPLPTRVGLDAAASAGVLLVG